MNTEMITEPRYTVTVRYARSWDGFVICGCEWKQREPYISGTRLRAIDVAHTELRGCTVVRGRHEVIYIRGKIFLKVKTSHRSRSILVHSPPNHLQHV